MGSICRHLHNARSHSTSYQQTTARCQGHRCACDCIDVHSHMGFLAVFARVLPYLESEASLPLQTGRRKRRLMLRLSSRGRRKGHSHPEQEVSPGPQGQSAVPAFGFRMFSLPSENLNETRTLLLFAQRFTGEEVSRPHSFHTEIQLQKSILGKDCKRCLQGCIPGLVDESFSSPTREKPIFKELKARNRSREGI